jgi:hypothetical protein
VIKDTDIKVRDRELRTRNVHLVSAEVTLHASGCVSFEEGLYGINHLKARLKEEILYKVYGEILHALREELYDLKYKVTEFPYDVAVPVDAAYDRVINLIREKMKVTQP